MDITLHSVAERGVPNRERIILRVDAPCNAASYAVLLGTSVAGYNPTPFADNFLWIGNGELLARDWIFLYSGHGESRVDNLSDDQRLFSLYWRRPTTILHNPYVVSILIKIGDYQALSEPLPPALPQSPLIPNQKSSTP